MKKYSTLLFFVLFSCYDNTADKLIFKDLKLIDSLMNKQIDILEKLKYHPNQVCVSWEQKDGRFLLNNLDLDSDKNMRDSILKAWHVSLTDYLFLAESAGVLSENGICKALDPDGYFIFRYRCGIKGHEEDGRYIFLKNRLNNHSLDFEYPYILDENEKMFLRIH